MPKGPEVAATWEPIESLQPWDRNPRRNDGEPVDRVAKSIQRFGFGAPIVARAQDRRIIAGHTRWKAAKQLGMTQVPVRFLPVDEAEAAALALADNKLTEITPWDDEALADVLRDLDAQSVDLDGLGWSAEEIDALLAGGEEEAKPETEEPPAPDDGPPDSQPGMVYELGPHRLACGDSTKAETWAALMGGATVSACVTDPPYGTSQPGVPHDTPEEHGPICRGVLGAMPLRGVCVAFASCRTFPVWLDSIREAGHEFHRMLWLYKQAQMGNPWRGWIMKSECALVSSHGEASWNDHHPYAHDCYMLASVTGEVDPQIGWHGSIKPIAVIRDIVQRVSRDGQIVSDPFGGSGTTLIACAMTGRVARLIELDPRYCDVIRRRWTKWARENGRDPGPGALEPVEVGRGTTA